ncbi:MAG: peptide deformylase [Gammaproteobacteria bacterium]|nr:peptide deformylase [Gammaproteobacteria bacterium]
MSVRSVLRMGDPVLYDIAAQVRSFNTPELECLIEDMFDTMAALDGAGLAAPQIGESRRVVIFGVDQNPRYPEADPVPRTVLINPSIEFLTDEVSAGWEGCLSVPGLRGLVERCERIRYNGYGLNGESISREVDGFHARVVQHECDHLNGILFPMRVKDRQQFGFESALYVGEDDPIDSISVEIP